MAQAQGWTAGPAPDVSAWTPGVAPTANFTQSDTTPNEVDSNTLGTFVKHLWAGVNPVQIGQMLPFPKILGGSGMDNPLFPVNVTKKLQAVKAQADEALSKGEYTKALTHYVESVIPILGPLMASIGDNASTGKYAAAAGDSSALAVNALVPKIAGGMKAAPGAIRDATSFAQDRGVPLDAATVSDNLAVKGTQALADRSIAGSLVATPAKARQAVAMERVGGELASEAHPVPTTPETAGTSLRNALTGKVAWHEQAATSAYDRLRALEQSPANRMNISTGETAPVDAITPKTLGELRRIYHEMDAMGFSKKNFNEVPTRHGGDLEVSGGAAGASVYDDILSNLSEGARPTRGAVQAAIADYLRGGKENAFSRAAVGVAEERQQFGTGRRVLINNPELPPSARDIITAPEKQRVTSTDMGLPVDVTQAKKALQPVYDQMMRQMPVTQQQANPGLKALGNILDGPDYAPLSQVDQDLSAIKALARQRGGLSKLAAGQLEEAVMRAAKNGGPDVVTALQQGRDATIAKYQASDVLDTLNDEPVRTVKALTAPKDASISQLRAVVQHVPDQAPVIARGFLEDLLDKPQKVAEWRKLGTETKAILFPKAGQAEALDHFFTLTDRISKTNVNPSGSGYVAMLGAQGAMIWSDPTLGAALQISGGTLAALLRSPVAIRALTRGLSLPVSAPVAARTAATANLVRAASAAGVPFALPAAAGHQPSTPAQTPGSSR